MKEEKARDLVQVRNPKSGRYIVIDREVGRILCHRLTEGPAKNIPIV